MLESVVESLPSVFRDHPIDCALILGSGWGDVLQVDSVEAVVSYSDLPGYGESTVVGHQGELQLLTIAGRRVAAFCGRRHYYEGCSPEQIVYPIELLRCLNVKTLLLTNAAGGLNPDARPGDLMAITDHLNLTGINPLRGPHKPEWGARFPDMTHVYDPELTELLMRLGGETMRSGIYAFSTGPSYETPAEVRALRALGGDAVGMSTVPEAILAHACGIRVAALSCITNLAAGLTANPLSHAEVLAESTAAKPKMAALVSQFIQALPITH